MSCLRQLCEAVPWLIFAWYRFVWFLLDGDMITKAVVSSGTGGWENLQLSVLDDVLKNDPNVHNHAVVSG